MMTTVYDIEAGDLIRVAAERLKGSVEKPSYVGFVKSSQGRERPPEDPDFWYKRCASILRQVYVNGPVGISTLRTRYGSRQDHVVHRHHHLRAGSSIIRDAFAELEKLKYVKNTGRGRVITPEGKAFLDRISSEIKQGKVQEQKAA